VDDLQKQKLQGALVGFNLGLALYFFVRYLPLFFAGRNVGWDWFTTQLLIGAVVGGVFAAIGYFALGLLQK
jgi:hypothetical protein